VKDNAHFEHIDIFSKLMKEKDKRGEIQ